MSSEMLAKRTESMKPSATLAITSRAKQLKKQGKDVLVFAAGEPDFPTPANIKQTAIEAIKGNFTTYTASEGIYELREAICTKFKRENNLVYSPEEILVSCGAKHSLQNAILAVVNEGDEVIIPTPHWVSYVEQVKLAGGTPVYAQTGEDLRISPATIKKNITKKTKLLILNTPNNPSGMIIRKNELAKIADLAVKHNILVISDEVYEHFIYDQNEHISIASLNNEIRQLTITVNSISKTYAMTGWRIGYAAGSSEIVKAMSCLQSQMTSNACSISQKAAVEALLGPQEIIADMRKAFDERRKFVTKELNSMKGIKCAMPEGAFYVFPDIRNTHTKDDLAFAQKLLDEKLVAVVPGTEFGRSGFIRISYASPLDELREGMTRLKEFCQ